MEYGWSPEYEDFRKQVRSFIAEIKTPELVAEVANAEPEDRNIGPQVRQVKKKLDERGWVKMCLPPDLGGEGRSLWYQFILQEELDRADVPYRGIPWMAPAIERFGSTEAKERYLPGLWSGESDFALGYSEPNAGTDLASLELRAVRDGDDWVINGQKIWTSSAHRSSHVWLAARTDPTAPKHRGISMFVVPLDSPGITVRPIYTMGSYRTNEVFFEDVRVADYSLIGEEGRGWYIAANALDTERVALGAGAVGSCTKEYANLLGHLQTHRPELLASSSTRRRLAEFKVDIYMQLALAMTNSAMTANGDPPNVEASMAKVVNSELFQRLVGTAMDMLGRSGALSRGAEDAPCDGRFELAYRDSPVGRFGGGTNEVQRDIIARRGLGLPR